MSGRALLTVLLHGQGQLGEDSVAGQQLRQLAQQRRLLRERDRAVRVYGGPRRLRQQLVARVVGDGSLDQLRWMLTSSQRAHTCQELSLIMTHKVGRRLPMHSLWIVVNFSCNVVHEP